MEQLKGLSLLISISFLYLSSITVKDSKEETTLPRVIITTDINNVGGDPDDKQSLAHLLMYANEVEIEAIIPDYWKGKGIETVNQAIYAYKEDYNNPGYTFQENYYPHPDSILKKVVKNGDEAVKRIISEAKKNDPRPLYILVWGNMTTIQKALFVAPEIASEIRVLTIATNIMAQNPDSEQNAEVEKYCSTNNWNGKGRDTIFYDSRFDKLWWIENDWAYNGMFLGDEPRSFLLEIKEYGQLGFYIWNEVQSHSWAHYFRAGDTPTLLYLLESIDHNDPGQSTWGGKFIKPFPHERPHYWIDDAGTNDWNYEEPCESWHLADEVYKYRLNSLIETRDEMYNSYRLKMDQLYKKQN